MDFRDPTTASTTVTVTVRAFARYAEVLGFEHTTLTLSAPATVADALATLRREAPGADRLPAAPLVAINLEQVGPDTPLDEGVELALLPPLAGG